MCGLCGILSGEAHWADLAPHESANERVRLGRRERLGRIMYLNRVLGAFACSVSDWQACKYQVSTFTGKTELPENLAELWASVERLTGIKPDPLSESVLERMGGGT